ncbi:MAG: hypothetical protein ACKO23_17300 [Gemmataceae bacterium]
MKGLLGIGVLALLLAGGLVSFLGTRESGESRLAALDRVAPATQDPVVSMELPRDHLTIPEGPHREVFISACTVCHSPRLAFTQPLLPEKKWIEVTTKMVAIYGASLTSEQQRDIVSYLTAVHGSAAP